MDTRIRIELDKELYECGAEVIGAIDVRTRTPLCVSKINLRFSKTVRMKLQKTEDAKGPDDDFDSIEKKQDGYTYEFEMYSNEDPLEEISSGHHTFPFKFRLRDGDGGSSEIKGLYFDFLCDIRAMYELCTEIYMFGAHNPMYMVKKEVHVIDPVTEPRTFHTAVKVSSPICFFSRKYDIAFELDKLLYYSGDCLTLRTAVVSGKPIVKQVECFIYEILNVSVNEKQLVRTKYIVGGEGEHEDRGVFRTSLRIPSATPSTVTENDFSMRAMLFVNIGFHKGPPIRIKKHLHIVKKVVELCPEIDSINILEGEVYPEKMFLLS